MTTTRPTTPRRQGRHRRSDSLTTTVCLVGDHLVKMVSTATAAVIAAIGLPLVDGPSLPALPAASDKVVELHLPLGR